MQPTSSAGEENRALLVALELYRLQSLRNMLLVVLLIQLVLIGIGVKLLLQENNLAPVSMSLRSNNSVTTRRPGELHRVIA